MSGLTPPKRPVVALPLQQIGSVDARGGDLDQYLVRPRAGGVDLAELQHLRGPRFAGNYRFHSPQRAIPTRTGRLGSGCSPRSRAYESVPGEVA